MGDSMSNRTQGEKMVSVIIHNDYEGPFTLVKVNKTNRELAKCFPNQYRVRRVRASVLANWKAEFARFGILQAIVTKVFNDER